MSDQDEWVEVASFAEVDEAETAVATLHEAGVESRVGRDPAARDEPLPPDERPPHPGVAVLVPAHQAEAAREILHDEPPEA